MDGTPQMNLPMEFQLLFEFLDLCLSLLLLSSQPLLFCFKKILVDLFLEPGLFQSSRETRGREPRMRERFRRTHHRSPQLQQDVVGVMGIRPRFTIFTDIVGWAQAVGKSMASGKYQT